MPDLPNPNPIRRRWLLALPLLPRVARAADAAPPTLDAIMGWLAATPDRRATFREERRFAALDTVLASTGHLVLRPGYLEKSTDWPQPERLEVSGGRVIITAGNDAPRVVDLNMAPELHTLIDAIRGPLTGDTATVARAFTATTAGTEADWSLLLVPRDPAAARLLKSAALHGHGGVVDRLAITQPNGDQQVMTIAPQ